MTRNNVLLLTTLGLLILVLGAIKICQTGRAGPRLAPIVLYEPLPHPYCTAVGVGASAFARQSGVRVRIVVGQESTQSNVDSNIESLFALGYRAFALYPVDPAGTKGLCAQLARGHRLVVAYGAQPAPGTDAPFAVATDTRQAATLAAEKLIALMGGHGRILNVLESMTDANTPIRVAAIESVVAQHPGVRIIQTIGDISTEEGAREKIESALAARGYQVDGVICTGYTTTVAAAGLLAEHNRRPDARRIHFVGLDTDPRVLAAIRRGLIDATVAQNPFGHGYISCDLLNLMLHGWRPRKPYQFIDSGCVVVTRANVDTFQQGIEKLTAKIVSQLKTKYLLPPGRPVATRRGRPSHA